MSTQPITPQHTTPVFAPDGTIAQIPDQYLPDAISHGGKLAVQMKTPDGSLHYVPHDQVVAAQKAGGVVNTDQGTPDNPEPKEGFWHSLGSVFGMTKEQLDARVANQQAHPVQSFLSDTGFGLGPAGNLIHSAATAGPEMAKKAYGESVAANDALTHKDFLSFLAHEIGGMGYTGAMVASPVLGESPAKAGEQLGAGNVSGALGTTTGLIAPSIIPEVPGAMKATGSAIERVAPYVGKGAKEAARFGGVGEFIHTGNPVALAGPVVAPLVEKSATGITSAAGRLLRKTGEALSPAQQTAATAQAQVDAGAIPADAGSNPNAPSTLPRQLSGEGVLNQALTSLDNQTLLKVAKSRGINVAREAQLKPGAANGTLVKKIIDDFSPDELDEARERGLEASLHKPLPADGVTPEAAAEAWRYKVLNTFFPDVAITKAMQTRVAGTLAEQAKARFEAARAAALQRTPQVPSAAPASYMTSGSDLIEALRQMAAKSGK